MTKQLSIVIIALGLLFSVCQSASFSDDEPLTLIGTIVKWQYPKAKIGRSQISGGETKNAKGDRTIASSLLKTTMTTPDSPEKVVAFYKALLKRDPTIKDKLGTKADEGRSVLFSDESTGRKLQLHTILVNTDKTSTTIIISRTVDEMQTSITWKQYYKHLDRK